MNRRRFLKHSIAHTLGASTMLSTMGAFASAKASMGQMTTMNQGSGYRALVCLYLYGGNDSFNMIVPRDNTRYQAYADSRGQSLALDQLDLLPFDDTSQGEFGFHPACGALQNLYNSQNLAVINNTGTLIRPTSKIDYQNNIQLPRHLFSHNSQQDQSMTGLPQQPSRSGWAGRMADLMHADVNSDVVVPFNLSIGGQNLLQVGSSTTPSIISPYGMPTFDACDLSDISSHCGQTLDQILQQNLAASQAFENAHARIYNRSHNIAQLVDSALQNAVTVDPNVYPTVPADFPGNPDLANQFQMVTRLISIAQDLGHSRSVFFVNLGGWDTHDNLLNNHNLLLSNLSENMAAFQSQLSDLGLDDQVLTFTASDFGRTLTSNGDGSDHGWGGNQLVMGSPTNLLGGNMYGTFPDLTLGSADDADLGRLIPTTPLDAYFATLVRWLGVDNTNMLDIFPNLINFDGAGTDLGFLL
ncbi:MAG: DUF1501 domain-containing protein [Marinicella sp.]